MSWPIRVQDQMIITTGDGRSFTPLYIRTTRSREFNVTEFNFPGLDGTFVDRRRPKGVRYNIEIVFSGENHLEQAQDFDGSALDSRRWIIEHPLYGRLEVQPITLEFDDRNYNVTQINSAAIETNEEPGLISTVSVRDQVDIISEQTLSEGAVSFAQKPASASALVLNNSIYRASVINTIPIVDSEEYTNLFSAANSAANNVISAPSAAITAAQRLILAPARFKTSVQIKLDSLENQLQVLFGNVQTGDSVADKILFENSAGAVLCCMCVAAVNPQAGNYTTVDSVLIVIEQITTQFNTYIELLDTISTDSNNSPDSYIADYEFISNLVYLVDYTVSNLIAIALNAQQERVVFIKADTNVIELAHTYYPNIDLDQALNNVMSANGWGLSSILGVSLGEKFIYYVE